MIPTQESLRFAGVRGTLLHARTWLPPAEPAAIVLIAHGFAEHSGRYAGVAEWLVESGYAVRALDHRGHGLSGGRRTSVVRFDDYVSDLHTLITDTQARWTTTTRMLIGHSLGGLIALSLALHHTDDVQALVLSAPAACPGKVNPITVLAGRALSRVAPDLPVLKLPLGKISRDQHVVDAYYADPLVFPTRIRARLGAEMLDAMNDVMQRLPSLRVPLLVMQGSADSLVDPGCGPFVFERAGSADKMLKVYPGLWHEIFNEPERETVVGDLLGWLDAHRSA